MVAESEEARDQIVRSVAVVDDRPQGGAARVVPVDGSPGVTHLVATGLDDGDEGTVRIVEVEPIVRGELFSEGNVPKHTNGNGERGDEER